MKRTYYTYRKDLKARARHMRNNSTKYEIKLWNYSKRDQLEVDFHRQKPIDNFILDFYCHEIRLGLEVDGEIHEKRKDYDAWRENKQAQLGITILRFKNEEVWNDIDEVVRKIENYIKENKDKSV